MQTVIPIYKFPGETPLECIQRFKTAFPEYQDLPITYAGRLDPMADGLLLLLAGDAVHDKDAWMKKDKVYTLTILFGVETDTYDVLGRIVNSSNTLINPSARGGPASGWQNHIGRFQQTFPPYSSYKIQGKPLFQWAREGKLDQIEIPSKEREIYSIDLLDSYARTSEELLSEVQKRVVEVNGDFRQEEVLADWSGLLSDKKRTWQLIKLRVSCSSGTYMRSFAQKLGKELETGAIAYSIKRESLGDYSLQ
jgi:tRNA pseudouridine55 synthase